MINVSGRYTVGEAEADVWLHSSGFLVNTFIVGLYFVRILDFYFQIEWKFALHWQVTNSSSYKQWNCGKILAGCMFTTHGTFSECDGEWHKKIPTQDQLNQFLNYCCAWGLLLRTYIGEPKGCRYFIFIGFSIPENVYEGDESNVLVFHFLFLEGSWLWPRIWLANCFAREHNSLVRLATMKHLWFFTPMQSL